MRVRGRSPRLPSHDRRTCKAVMARGTGRGRRSTAPLRGASERLNLRLANLVGDGRRGGASGRAKLPLEVLAIGLDVQDRRRPEGQPGGGVRRLEEVGRLGVPSGARGQSGGGADNEQGESQADGRRRCRLTVSSHDTPARERELRAMDA